MTPQEQRVNKFAVRCALYHLKRLRLAQEAYDEEVRAWYASGEGRAPNWRTEVVPAPTPEDPDAVDLHRWNAGGKGYRFPACIHGMSYWTDYDNICGPCEDSLTLQQEALYLGHQTYHAYMERSAVMGAAQRAHAPEELVQGLMDWALAVLPDAMSAPKIRRNLP